MHKPISLFFFADGPLMDKEARRADLVRRMAKDLIEQDAFRCRDAAIDVLMARGYPTFDIFRPGMVDDVCQVAQQEIVAVEMSQP